MQIHSVGALAHVNAMRISSGAAEFQIQPSRSDPGVGEAAKPPYFTSWRLAVNNGFDNPARLSTH